MADDTLLEIGSLVDVGAVETGMNEMASAVQAGTSAATAAMSEMASATEASGSIIQTVVGNIGEFYRGVLGGAVEEVKAQFASLPAVVTPAVEETKAEVTSLEGKLTELGEVAEASTKGIGAGIGGLGSLLGAGALVALMGHFADETNKEVLELGHLAEKSGISISSLAGLQTATKELGIGFESVSTGMVRLERAQALAVEGNKQQEAAFQRIGISIGELKSLTPEQLFAAVSEGIKSTGSSADAAATAISLLGRGGAALIPIFKEYGGEIINVMKAQGEASGINEEAYQNALKFQKASADLGVELRRLALEVMPTLTRALKEVQDNIKTLGSSETVAQLKVWAGNVAGVLDELNGTAQAVGVMLRDQFTKLPGLPSDEALAKHRANAKELEEIWRTTAANVRRDLGQQTPLTIEESFNSVLAQVKSQFPTAGNTPSGGGGNAGKEAEQKALAEAQLQVQLSAIKAWEAAQKVAYEEGKISAEDWANQQTVATNRAYDAQQTYFSKLRALYAGDPTKEATVNQQAAKFEYESSAKASDDLAGSLAKLNETLKEYSKDTLKAADAAQKELDSDLQRTGKSVQDYVNSLKALGAAQAGANTADFAAREEAIRNMAASGVISEREKARELSSLYREEAESQVSSLQDQLTRQQQMLQAAEAAQTAAAASGDAARLNEARAAYNNQAAAVQQTQNRINQIITQANNKIDAENQKLFHSFANTYNRITGQINGAVAGWLTGHITLQKALMSVWSSILTDAITAIMKIGERWVLQHLLMRIANKLFHTETLAEDTAAAAAKQGVISATNVAEATSDAAVAAAGQFAWYSQTFPPIAPAMAAAALAQGMAYAGMAAFGGGGIVEGDQIARLHNREMVLPPALSTGVQNMIASGGTTNNNYSSSGDTQTGDVHVHIHQGSVHAMDSSGVQSVLKKEQRTIAKIVQRQLMSGRLDLGGRFK